MNFDWVGYGLQLACVVIHGYIIVCETGICRNNNNIFHFSRIFRQRDFPESHSCYSTIYYIDIYYVWWMGTIVVLNQPLYNVYWIVKRVVCMVCVINRKLSQNVLFTQIVSKMYEKLWKMCILVCKPGVPECTVERKKMVLSNDNIQRSNRVISIR